MTEVLEVRAAPGVDSAVRASSGLLRLGAPILMIAGLFLAVGILVGVGFGLARGTLGSKDAWIGVAFVLCLAWAWFWRGRARLARQVSGAPSAVFTVTSDAITFPEAARAPGESWPLVDTKAEVSTVLGQRMLVLTSPGRRKRTYPARLLSTPAAEVVAFVHRHSGAS